MNVIIKNTVSAMGAILSIFLLSFSSLLYLFAGFII